MRSIAMASHAKSPAASWISIVLIVVGAVMAVLGTVSYATVTTTLADERIIVSEEACLGGSRVNHPLAAYCEAMIIQTHAVEATGGKTYAELDREDPLRQTAMTGSFLRASLFTSVVAFGVSALIVALGALFILTGIGLRSLTGRKEEAAAASAPPAATA
jgi:flagellar basal body-associated protein FliL